MAIQRRSASLIDGLENDHSYDGSTGEIRDHFNGSLQRSCVSAFFHQVVFAATLCFCCRWLWDCPKMVIPSTRPCIKLTSHVPADGDDLADRLGSSRQALWFDTDTFSAYIPLCLWLQGFSTRALSCCPAIWYPANPSGLVICFVDCWLLNRWGK